MSRTIVQKFWTESTQQDNIKTYYSQIAINPSLTESPQTQENYIGNRVQRRDT